MHMFDRDIPLVRIEQSMLDLWLVGKGYLDFSYEMWFMDS